jgi:hypothetical protein
MRHVADIQSLGQIGDTDWTLGSDESMLSIWGKPFEGGKFWVFDHPVTAFVRYQDMRPSAIS